MALLLSKTLRGLYTVEKLSEGYDPNDEKSIVKTYSFKQYQKYRPFKEKGRIASQKDLFEISKHDARLTDYLLNYLYESDSSQAKKVVGIMGGHGEARSSKPYSNVADLCRFLAQNDYLVVSGGGPGLMEAAHLGAYFSQSSDDDWKDVKSRLRELRNKPYDKIPKSELVDKRGVLLPGKAKDYADFHAWYKFADDLRRSWQGYICESLAISTWEYGQEPVMPFATHYACYFQNSIRESALVREARAGIVYARGGGGTLREIWQDVEENYYCESRNSFTPMIFFDHESIWGDGASKGSKDLDIFSTLVHVLDYRLGKKEFTWKDKVVSTTDGQQILNLLNEHAQRAQKKIMELYQAYQTLP